MLDHTQQEKVRQLKMREAHRNSQASFNRYRKSAQYQDWQNGFYWFEKCSRLQEKALCH